jgi:hypothetical protein
MPSSFRRVLRSWWTLAVAVVLVVGYVVWPVVVEVAKNYDKYRITIPMMAEDIQRWRNAKAPDPARAQKVEAPPAPTPPPPKKAEAPKKVAQPCIASAAAMIEMLKAGGGTKYARHFDVFFKDKESCFVLKVAAVGNVRMALSTNTSLDPTPTFYVTPRDKADLQRYRPSDLLRIRGRLARYVDVPGTEPDEVHIEVATFTRVDADELETGSLPHAIVVAVDLPATARRDHAEGSQDEAHLLR